MKTNSVIAPVVAMAFAFAASQSSFGAALAPVAHISNIGFASALVLDGNYLYVAAYPDLRVYDVSNPGKPSLAGNLEKAGYSIRMVAANHCIYATGSTNSLLVYDVSSPTKPVHASTTITDRREFENSAADLAIVGHYAYVTHDGFSVYDVSSPGNLKKVWHTNASFSSVAIGYNTAYVCNTDELWMFDVSDPLRPNFVGRYSTNKIGASPVVFFQARCVENFYMSERVKDFAFMTSPVLQNRLVSARG